MKKVIGFSLALLCIVFLSSMIMINSSAGLSMPAKKHGNAGKPIPSHVMKIAERSCVKCHAEGGKKMAMWHVNLSKWNEYSAEKQAKKANNMCRMVTKGKMPPKGFRENNPGAAPTKDEVKVICDWASSIRTEK